jgi:hypothetical protein
VASVCTGDAVSLTAMLVRLRFSVALAPLGVSLGVSGAVGVAGAASSRARARVERRGSDMAATRWTSLSFLSSSEHLNLMDG